MQKREKEVLDIMDILFDQDTIMRNYEHELREEGRAEGRVAGIKEGREAERLELLLEMLKEKAITMSYAAKRYGVSVKEFKKLAKV